MEAEPLQTADNILDTVGNTPLIKLQRVGLANGATILPKGQIVKLHVCKLYMKENNIPTFSKQ